MRLLRLALLLVCLTIAGSALGQGCSACKDSVAGSSAKTQQGFRRAIPVLAIPAVGLFVAMLMISRRAGTAKQNGEEPT